MLHDDVLERNMQLYLEKMEEKHKQTSEKLATLQRKLNDSARKIQNAFRMCMLRKRTRAALKIQRWFKKCYQKRVKERQKIHKFRRIFFSYKIFYFFQKIFQKQKSKFLPVSQQKSTQTSLLKKVKAKSHQYILTLSAFSSELSYIRKYKTYDKKSFLSQWQSYQKKQRQWIWEQIRKKWIKKKGQLWINEQQKEVNAEKYINNVIQQTYNRHYQSFQESQRRLSQHQKSLKVKMDSWIRSHFFFLLFSKGK